METRLYVYDQSRLGAIAFNGQYVLGVETENVTYTYNPSYYSVLTVPVYTNYYVDGVRDWTAEVIEGGDWLHLTRWNNDIGDWETPFFQEDYGWGNDHQWAQISIAPDVLATPGAVRTGKIRVKAGRLSIDITVTQKGPEAVETLDIVLLDTNGTELPYDLINSRKVYKMDFDLNPSEATKRIYVQTTGAKGYQLVAIGKSDIPELANVNSEQIRYPSPNPDPYAIPVSDRGDWTAHQFENEPFKAFNIQPLAGQDNMEYWDMFTFQAYQTDQGGNWTDFMQVDLKIYQGDWIIIADFRERYLLGSVTYPVDIKANAPWEIVRISETRTAGPNPGPVDRFLLSDKSDAGYLKVGATGGIGADVNNQVTNTFDITTAQWIKGLAGKVEIEFKSTQNTETKPNKTFGFEVFEHHQDYTSASTQTPLFYTFPIALPRTSQTVGPYVWTTWYQADEACRAIGPGWRLPTYTEALIFTVYRPTLFNPQAKWDPYSKLDYPYVNGWYFYQHWTLGVLGTKRATINAFNGYGDHVSPELNKDEDWMMARCVYTQWSSNETNPTLDPAKLPNPGSQHYPYIDRTQAGGPVIVSRSGSNGVNAEAIGNPTGTGDIYSTHNIVAPKLQIAPDDLNPGFETLYTRDQAMTGCAEKFGVGWRLPTQKEILLIFAMGGTSFHANSSIPNGYARLGDGMGSGFVPLKDWYSYWTSSTDNLDDEERAWTLGTTWGGGFPIDPTVTGSILGDDDIMLSIGGARCVRTLP